MNSLTLAHMILRALANKDEPDELARLWRIANQTIDNAKRGGLSEYDQHVAFALTVARDVVASSGGASDLLDEVKDAVRLGENAGWSEDKITSDLCPDISDYTESCGPLLLAMAMIDAERKRQAAQETPAMRAYRQAIRTVLDHLDRAEPIFDETGDVFAMGERIGLTKERVFDDLAPHRALVERIITKGKEVTE